MTKSSGTTLKPLSRRSRKKLDPDLKVLVLCDRALRATSPGMRRATCEFLWDKYVRNAEKRAQEGMLQQR